MKTPFEPVPADESALDELDRKIIYEGFRPDLPVDMPDELKSLVKWCWAQDPDKRPQDFSEVEEVLFTLL